MTRHDDWFGRFEDRAFGTLSKLSNRALDLHFKAEATENPEERAALQAELAVVEADIRRAYGYRGAA